MFQKVCLNLNVMFDLHALMPVQQLSGVVHGEHSQADKVTTQQAVEVHGKELTLHQAKGVSSHLRHQNETCRTPPKKNKIRENWRSSTLDFSAAALLPAIKETQTCIPQVKESTSRWRTLIKSVGSPSVAMVTPWKGKTKKSAGIAYFIT